MAESNDTRVEHPSPDDLRRQADEVAAATRRSLTIARAVIASLMMALALITILFARGGSGAQGVGAGLSIAACAATVAILLWGWALSSLHAKLWRAVEFGNVRVLISVCDYLTQTGVPPIMLWPLRAPLIRLLGCMRSGDARLFSPSERARIVMWCLRHSGDAGIRAAMLEALRHIGDEHSLRMAERWANGFALTASQRAVQRRARELLPEIRACAEEVSMADRLLRPAEPPPESTLVRPIEGAPMGDEALLVRPLDGERQ